MKKLLTITLTTLLLSGTVLAWEFTRGVCPSELILTQNLKAPDRGESYVRNGKYHWYSKGVVTEAHTLQKHLNRLGFNAGVVDGIIGPNTKGAILRLQKYLGTVQDGYVGPKTRELLNGSCGEDNNFSKDTSVTITNYKVAHKDISYSDDIFRAIRYFTKNNTNYVLAVNLKNNTTKIIKTSEITFLKNQNNFNSSSYKKALDSLKNKNGLTNTGLKNDISNLNNSVYLTADFCPSRKTVFEKKFIEDFIKNGNKNIGIAITKSWKDKHPNGFNWLVQQNNSGKLNITWINHSSKHNYNFHKPLKNNFLLIPGTNLESEILGVEKMLLENNQIPSIFARFPGLVSNKKIRADMIEKYGLIFLGSDAWLAKGEHPHNGSIILIHGNKNEPLGIKKAYEYLKNKDTKIKFENLVNSI